MFLSATERQVKESLPEGSPRRDLPPYMYPYLYYTTPEGKVVPRPNGEALLATQQAGRQPMRVICLYCNQETVTNIKYRPSRRAHVIAALFCVTLLWPCVCIPYCVDSCRHTDHYCSNCNANIGVHVN